MKHLTEEELLKMDTPSIVAYYSPFLKHVPLSEEHRSLEEAKALKKQMAADKKARSEAEKERKAAEKEMLAKMSPEQAKQWRKNKKNEKSMAGQPTLL